VALDAACNEEDMQPCADRRPLHVKPPMLTDRIAVMQLWGGQPVTNCPSLVCYDVADGDEDDVDTVICDVASDSCFDSRADSSTGDDFFGACGPAGAKCDSACPDGSPCRLGYLNVHEAMGVEDARGEWDLDFEACSMYVNAADRCGLAFSGYIVPILSPYLKGGDDNVITCLGSQGESVVEPRCVKSSDGMREQRNYDPQFPVKEFLDDPLVGKLIAEMGLTVDLVETMPQDIYSQLEIIVGWGLRHLLYVEKDPGEVFIDSPT